MDNAGYISTEPVTKLDSDSSWAVFETNMKGSIYTAQAYARTARKDHAVIIDVSSIAAIMPPIPNGASYSASKLAATKIWEYYAAENPNHRVVSIQPGQIETDMARSIGLKGADHGKHKDILIYQPKATDERYQSIYRVTLQCGLQALRPPFCMANLSAQTGMSRN